MLILFRPWTNPSELRNRCRSWYEEYHLFLQGCGGQVKRLIDNMQLLHECRDAHDDHFANRANNVHCTRQHQAEHNHMGEVLTEDLLCEHLQQIEDYRSDNIDQIAETVNGCVSFVENSGFFNSQSNEDVKLHDEEMADGRTVCLSGPKDNNLELIWQQTYDQCKLKSKHALNAPMCQDSLFRSML